MATQPSGYAGVNDAPSHALIEGRNEPAPSSSGIRSEYEANILGNASPDIPMEIVRGARDLQQDLGMEVWLLVQANQDAEEGLASLAEPTRRRFFLARDSLPRNQKIALMIDSPGGDPGAAYRLATFLRRRCGGFVAVVPRWAKSAATLLALGADEIILGDYGELGPLDMQLPDSQSETLASALNEVQALYRLYDFAMGAFDETMFRLRDRSQLTTKELMPLAISFAMGMTRPLLKDLDTVHYTYVSRELKLAHEYAIRLLRNNYAADEASEIARHLVEDYYDHGFVIDADEAVSIGLRTVKQPSAEQGRILDNLATNLDNLTFIGRVQERSGDVS